MARQECIVSSELLPFLEQDLKSKPLVDSANVVSKFTFKRKISSKTNKIEVDSDGDLIVPRHEDSPTSSIYLEHCTSTPLDSVGLQVWRGALLLADWALYHSELLRDATVLELGSGTGLTALATATVAKEVIATDANIGKVLPLIQSNTERNKSILRNSIKVLELDFFADQWSPDLIEALSRTSVIITADVIYDDVLTEAFVKTLKRLLSTPPSKTIYMALEKRYVFTIEDLDNVAPCFEHFLRCISHDFPWTLEVESCEFPQYFKYEKTKELAMWKIVSKII